MNCIARKKVSRLDIPVESKKARNVTDDVANTEPGMYDIKGDGEVFLS